MTLQARLKQCMLRGNLTVADLSRWFGRPYPTVRSWVFNGTKLSAAPRDEEEFLFRLSKLERMIKTGQRFPVPPLTRQGRIEYLRKF